MRPMRAEPDAPENVPTEIRALVARGRHDDALSALARMREQPGAAQLARVIQWARDVATVACLNAVGERGAVLLRTERELPALSNDERYALSLVDGVTSIDRLVDTSTLGALRTAQALAALARQSLITARTPTTRPPTTAATAHDGTVIVADGSATQAALTRTMLRVALPRGAKVVSASDGAEVLELTRSTAPLLIVAEFQLGAMDGLEMLRRVRDSALTARTPVLLIASRIDAEFLRTRLASAAAVVARPIDSKSLRDAVSRLIAAL